MACASRLGHKLMGKNTGRNLQYGPRTRLVRGMYSLCVEETGLVKNKLGECSLKDTDPDGVCSKLLVSNPACKYILT